MAAHAAEALCAGRKQIGVYAIIIGGFSFDFSFVTRTGGNDLFVEFLKDDMWKWVKPDPLIDTNRADRDGDVDDDYPDWMLDFVFVAGAGPVTL